MGNDALNKHWNGYTAELKAAEYYASKGYEIYWSSYPQSACDFIAVNGQHGLYYSDWRQMRLYENFKKLKVEDPVRYLYLRTKDSARHRGIRFKLTLDDISIPDVCPILCIPLRYSELRAPNTPTVDRINNQLGYLPGNIGVISLKANMMKQDNTVETLEKLLEYTKQGLDTPSLK